MSCDRTVSRRSVAEMRNRCLKLSMLCIAMLELIFVISIVGGLQYFLPESSSDEPHNVMAKLQYYFALLCGAVYFLSHIPFMVLLAYCVLVLYNSKYQPPEWLPFPRAYVSREGARRFKQ